MLTERDVHRLLGTDLPVHRLVLGEEFDVWALGADLIAKFSRTPYDADKVPLEHAVHPLLRELLGPVVPDVHSVGEMDEPGLRFIVQERATGIQGQGADGVTVTAGDGLAEHVGWLLGRLHTVEAEEVFALGLGERVVSFQFPDLDETVTHAVEEVIGDDLPRFLGTPPPEPSARSVLCHTDIKGEHMFVDDDHARISAIIDWADTEVCDPARDYAGLATWLGPSFARAAVAAGGADDDGLTDRAVWLAQAGSLYWMNEVMTGREDAPLALIEQELRAAFAR